MFRATAVALSLFVSLSALAAPAPPDPTYVALRAAAPDGRTITLTNFVFERDVFRFTLNGKLCLLAPVEGKTPGAVFIGQGSYELKPASAFEQRELAVNTGDDDLTSLSDQFETAIFLGTALVSAAEKSGPPTSGSPDPAAIERWNDYLKQQRKTLHTNLQVRQLQEIVDNQAEPFFFAWLHGKKYPPAALIVDPRGAESVHLAGSYLGGEQTMMLVISPDKGGVWYSSRYRSEIEKELAPAILPEADADHYLVDATIHGAELSATSTMTFATTARRRVLSIDLSPKLRIEEAAYAPAGDPSNWTPIPFIQEDHDEDPDAAVVFPTALEAGQKYLLRIRYAGKEVLEDAGDGNFTVKRRDDWYPNVGVFSDLATYELRFRTPRKFEIVAVGTETENRVEGKERVTVWKAERPIRVAGFNYGRFKKLTQTDKDSGITFDVYTNPGTPDIIREINQILAAQEAAAQYTDDPSLVGPGHVMIDTGSLAKAAMADGINAARTGNAFFGPLSERRVSITQQSQWFFGQSWPTLIYMPYVAFLSGTQRNTLGLNDAKDFVDNVGPHELAHQWWGHQVGFASYHDEWLSEGFAEFTAALVAQQTGGWARYNDFFEKARRNILELPRGASISNQDAGPISQGWRVSTWRNSAAYGALVYSKGAYVVHMLRMAMWDARTGDQDFTAMMKDFAATYAGKSPTTRDFQHIVEKHITPSLRLTRDGSLGWFFDQWVYGTAIPKLDATFDVADAGGGKFKISGSVTQSAVPDNFATVVPLYVQFDKKSLARIGTFSIVGNSTKPVEFEIALPKKPEKLLIDANHDVLTR